MKKYMNITPLCIKLLCLFQMLVDKPSLVCEIYGIVSDGKVSKCNCFGLHIIDGPRFVTSCSKNHFK